MRTAAAAAKLPLPTRWERLPASEACLIANRSVAVSSFARICCPLWSGVHGPVAGTVGLAQSPHALRLRQTALQQHGVMPQLYDARAQRPDPVVKRSMSLQNIFGDGDETGGRTVVESYDDSGFVVNGTLMQGAVILLPSTSYLWNVSDLEDVTWDSLVLLRLLKNRPEICIFGTGRRMKRLPPEILKEIKKLGINVDVADTVNALATFNVLNEEGRNVVGCFVPLDALEKQREALAIAESGASKNEAEGAAAPVAGTGRSKGPSE